jgi:hypothetical protein
MLTRLFVAPPPPLVPISGSSGFRVDGRVWAVAGINVEGATDEADLADEADNAWMRGRITAPGDG